MAKRIRRGKRSTKVTKQRNIRDWVFVAFAIVMAVSLLLPVVAQLFGVF